MADHLPLNALKAFEAAARHLSFSKAAEELHVTPAAVSQQIKTLEDLLGIQLFHRLNRSLALTRAGQAGLPKLSEGFLRLNEGIRSIREQEEGCHLTVWMAPSFAAKWLVPRLHRFADRYPDIDLRISASIDLIDSAGARNSIPAEAFRQNDVDIAIRFGSGDYPGCRVDKLLAVNAVPLCSPRLLEDNQVHPLRCPDDLRFHTLLHDDTVYEGRPDWATWLKAAAVEGIDASRGVHFNHVSLALEAAADGQGVVLSMQPLAAADLAAGRLVIPFELSIPLQSAFYVISLEDSAGDNDTKIAAFREWLLQEAAADEEAMPLVPARKIA
jgi:LysR family glycine cleavage system transcriptional activator